MNNLNRMLDKAIKFDQSLISVFVNLTVVMILFSVAAVVVSFHPLFGTEKWVYPVIVQGFLVFLICGIGISCFLSSLQNPTLKFYAVNQKEGFHSLPINFTVISLMALALTGLQYMHNPSIVEFRIWGFVNSFLGAFILSYLGLMLLLSSSKFIISVLKIARKFAIGFWEIIQLIVVLIAEGITSKSISKGGVDEYKIVENLVNRKKGKNSTKWGSETQIVYSFTFVENKNESVESLRKLAIQLCKDETIRKELEVIPYETLNNWKNDAKTEISLIASFYAQE